MTGTDVPATVPDQASLLDGVRDVLTQTLRPEDLARVDLSAITLDTAVLSLPLDSLALMALMAALEERYRVFIPDEKAFAFERVGDLIDHLSLRLAAKAARA
ncbi:MAG: hypothetical protein JNL54_11950 [Kineosporiaceae bacterium]|nr:hypothetical protein [Kineosporiaceae bacterium]